MQCMRTASNHVVLYIFMHVIFDFFLSAMETMVVREGRRKSGHAHAHSSD